MSILNKSSALRMAEKYDYVVAGFDVVLNLLIAYKAAMSGRKVFIYDREDNGLSEEFFLLNTSRISLSSEYIVSEIYRLAGLNFPVTHDIVTLCRYIVHAIKRDCDGLVRYTQKLVMEPKLSLSKNNQVVCDLKAMSAFTRPKHDYLAKMYTIRDRLTKHESVAESEFIVCKSLILTTPVYNFSEPYPGFINIGIAKRPLNIGVPFGENDRVMDYQDIESLARMVA